SLIAYRLTPVFVVFTVPILAVYYEKNFPRVFKILATVVIILLIAASLYSNRKGLLSFGISTNSFPVSAVRFIKQNGLSNERTFSNYEWGGYLIWEDIPVFVDGRTLRKEALTSYYHIMFQGKTEGLDYWKVSQVLFSGADITTGKPMALLDSLVNAKNRWVLLYGDEKAVVFIRNEERFSGLIKRYSIPSIFAYNLVQMRAKKILSIKPDDPIALASFAYASFKKGMKGVGKPYIVRAVSIDNENPFVQQVAGLYGNR
ncbi:MAG: hypothetical protein D6726_12810, partial [Nitrospirae bacterium]